MANKRVVRPIAPVPGRYPSSNPFRRARVPRLGTPATRSQRLVGALIDAVVFGLMVALLRLAGVAWYVGTAANGVLVVGLIHYYGATPGKFVVGSRVKDVSTGAFPAWHWAVVRWAVPWLVTMAGVWRPLGIVGLAVELTSVAFVLFRADGRAVHDLAANTLVVDNRSGR